MVRDMRPRTRRDVPARTVLGHRAPRHIPRAPLPSQAPPPAACPPESPHGCTQAGYSGDRRAGTATSPAHARRGRWSPLPSGAVRCARCVRSCTPPASSSGGRPSGSPPPLARREVAEGNAHVPDAGLTAMRAARLAPPNHGGEVVARVPFLQDWHGAPRWSRRRYRVALVGILHGGGAKKTLDIRAGVQCRVHAGLGGGDPGGTDEQACGIHGRGRSG